MKKIITTLLTLFISSFSLINSMGVQEPSEIEEKKISKIASGFDAVSYTGSYGFDGFIAKGGASSDREVLSYLRESMLASYDTSSLEFASTGFGCSTISTKNSSGESIFGRNFDWMKSNIMVIKSNPYNGYSSISTVNMDFIFQATGAAGKLLPDNLLTIAALYAPLDGMNEMGLAVAVNMIEDSSTIEQQTSKPDLTTTTAIRLLLDKAANVDEAVKLLKSYDLHASFGLMIHFAISDADGNSVAVEYVNNSLSVVETPILTNFYLTEGDKKGIGSAQSHRRFEILTELNESQPTLSENGVRDALSSVSKKHFEEFLSTEWSVVFNQESLTANYYHRENYNKVYQFKID